MSAKVRFIAIYLLVIASALLYSHSVLLGSGPSGLALSQSTVQTEADNDRGTVKAKEFISSRVGGTQSHPGRYRSRQIAPQDQSLVGLGVTIGRGRRATERRVGGRELELHRH